MTQPEAFNAAPVLRGLTGFQRNTVEHVIDRFYGTDPTDRFLVADETGLGKTIVARGVIARTIEELQHTDAVDRIDIVYVCSNLDLAHQNLRKLNVTGDVHHGIASRLTLMAKHSLKFSLPGTGRFTKPINLVSFTPGTSFSKGWSSGTAEERAMIFLLLEEHLHLSEKGRKHNAYRILRGSLTKEYGLSDRVACLRAELKAAAAQRGQGDVIDTAISAAFLMAAREEGLLDEFEDLLANFSHIEEPGKRTWPLVGSLRAVLARTSIQLLTPDLVILDEFQRFRELLDKETDTGNLARPLFEYRDDASDHRAKVLLLSATPFKPFTYAEEATVGDDHHRDFLEVVKFLANGDEAGTVRRVADALSDYRTAVVTGQAASDLTDTVRYQLLQVMTRTERPRSVTAQMTEERLTELGTPPQDDIMGFVALKQLARQVKAPFSIEYWKAAPYFINFMDGYQIADRVREALKDPERAASAQALLDRTQRIDFEAVRQYAPISLGNSRLRALAASTIEAGWWKLLWVPPSLPYLEPGGPFAEPFAQSVSKHLIFSSWTATPTAVASLLSYEADRLGAGDKLGTTAEDRLRERNSRRSRLAYRLDREGDRDRPSSMSTLALFWPMPGLAALADPRSPEFHRGVAGRALNPTDLIADVVEHLRAEHPEEPDAEPLGPAATHWFEALRRPDSYPDGLTLEDVQNAVGGASDGDDDRAEQPADAEVQDGPTHEHKDLRARHVDLALKIRGAEQDRRIPDETRASVAQVAAHSPGNVAYRALRRVAWDQPAVTKLGLWSAAARVSSALRTLFSRPETTLLLDELIPGQAPEVPYWRKVLLYCAWGNLQAVLDEYVHHLWVSQGAPDLDDADVLELARMVATALELRSASYEVFDPDHPEQRPKFWARFALRFGGRRDNQESNRQPLVRQAFNSPFWPFVLATTSVGQEGVDFHWWSHAVFHWNTPANPIDFEQREGRVDRYDGHAVRLNIAARHAEAILASDEPNPWRVAYELAQDEVDNVGEFAPHWVYPGAARIERHVAPYPLSIDETRLADIKRDVALYRLTFGQPRQEDMLELLRRHYSEATTEQLEALRLDLSAPARTDVRHEVSPDPEKVTDSAS